MSLPRFILSEEALRARPLVLSGQDAHHCRILRLKPDDPILVSDGCGREYHARISRFLKNAVELEVGGLSGRRTESPVAITLFQGFAKGSKLDWVLQKTTELGVARIVPVLSQYSQMKKIEGREHRLERWQEIIRQAARQSGRTVLPEVLPPCNLAESFSLHAKDSLGLFFQVDEMTESCGWNRLSALPRPTAVSLWVGPEGGFSKDEVVMAVHQGLHQVTMGPRVLRSESAGITAVALAQFAWGDLAG